MPLNLDVGDPFPDHRLADHTGTEVSLVDIAQGMPLFLAFFRGPW